MCTSIHNSSRTPSIKRLYSGFFLSLVFQHAGTCTLPKVLALICIARSSSPQLRIDGLVSTIRHSFLSRLPSARKKERKGREVLSSADTCSKSIPPLDSAVGAALCTRTQFLLSGRAMALECPDDGGGGDKKKTMVLNMLDVGSTHPVDSAPRPQEPPMGVSRKMC